MTGWMQGRLWIGTAAGLALAACGGEDASNRAGEAASAAAEITENSPADAVADAYVSEMGKVAAALEQVAADEMSADAAASAIRSAAEALDQMSDVVEADGDEAQWLLMALTRRQDFIEVQSRMGVAMAQLSQKDPELLEEVMRAMAELPDPE